MTHLNLSYYYISYSQSRPVYRVLTRLAGDRRKRLSHKAARISTQASMYAAIIVSTARVDLDESDIEQLSTGRSWPVLRRQRCWRADAERRLSADLGYIHKRAMLQYINGPLLLIVSRVDTKAISLGHLSDIPSWMMLRRGRLRCGMNDP